MLLLVLMRIGSMSPEEQCNLQKLTILARYLVSLDSFDEITLCTTPELSMNTGDAPWSVMPYFQVSVSCPGSAKIGFFCVGFFVPCVGGQTGKVWSEGSGNRRRVRCARERGNEAREAIGDRREIGDGR